MPTKPPKIHYTDDKDVPKKPSDLSEIGFRPTKSPEKPNKKYTKGEATKDGINNNVFNKGKYEYEEYENERHPSQVGPGYFNPDTSKNQYPDYMHPYGDGHNQQQHPLDKNVPPEIYSVFGQPPQGPFRIEHLLQQIQGADPNQGPLSPGQSPNVYLHTGQNAVNFNQFGQVQGGQQQGGHQIAPVSGPAGSKEFFNEVIPHNLAFIPDFLHGLDKLTHISFIIVLNPFRRY